MNTGMEYNARKRSLLLLTLFAFFVNILLPFAAVYNPSSAQAAQKIEKSALFGEKILICTADGFKWVTWEELEQKQGKHPGPGEKQHYECPLCYIAAHATKDFLPATQVIFTYTITEKQQARLNFSDDVLQSRFSAYAYQSRAPPYSA